jgi:AraC-like DNA-binding protein
LTVLANEQNKFAEWVLAWPLGAVPTMETASTIRVAPALAAIAVVRDFGLDPTAILTEAGWSSVLLNDPDNIVPFAALGRLIEVAATRTACPHFGLLLGQKAGTSVIGVLGFASRHAPDVRSALLLLSQRLADHDRGGVATFTEDSTVATLGYRVLDPKVPATEHITTASLAIGFQLMKVLCGPYRQPLETTFAMHRPRDVKPYQHLFGDEVRFNAGQSAMSFAAYWLDAKVMGADPELQRVLLRALEETKISEERNLRDEVRGVLAGMIGHGGINQVAVASSFGLSSRTLHRRLAALGASFHDLLDEVRCETACKLLENTTVPVAQVALMLGYSEVSAFTRSFKRRLACGPGAWCASRGPGISGAGRETTHH